MFNKLTFTVNRPLPDGLGDISVTLEFDEPQEDIEEATSVYADNLYRFCAHPVDLMIPQDCWATQYADSGSPVKNPVMPGLNIYKRPNDENALYESQYEVKDDE